MREPEWPAECWKTSVEHWWVEVPRDAHADIDGAAKVIVMG